MSDQLWVLEAQYMDEEHHSTFAGVFSSLALAKHEAERITQGSISWEQFEDWDLWTGFIDEQSIVRVEVASWDIYPAQLDKLDDAFIPAEERGA